jgi:hypothetical protein
MGFCERFMRAGAEGAKRFGFLGMLGGFGTASLGEAYRVGKVWGAALTPGKSTKVANQEYRRAFEDTLEGLSSRD